MRLGLFLAGGAEWGGITQYSRMLATALAEPPEDLGGVPSVVAPAGMSERVGRFCPASWPIVELRQPGLAGWIRSRVRNERARAVLKRMYQPLRRYTYRPHDPDATSSSHPADVLLRAAGLQQLLFAMPSDLAVETGLNAIMPIHDIQHRLQPHFPEFSTTAHWEWMEYVCRGAARNGTLILADSEVGRQDLLDCYEEFGMTAEQVRVLPYTVPPYIHAEAVTQEAARVRAAFELPERFFFYPAQFWPHKNHARLIEALGLLKIRSRVRIPLVLAGSVDTPMYAATFATAMQTAERMGVADQVQYLGYVPDEFMTGLYGASTGLVMPSFFGNTNIPLIESWALGCPVVTSDIRGVREFCRDAAVLVEPGSAESIGEGLLSVWSGSADTDALIAAGRARAATLSPDAFRKALFDILREDRGRRGDHRFAGVSS